MSQEVGTGIPADGELRGEELAARVVEALGKRGETLATCESLTAGLLAATVATVPGASAILRGGLITYATEVKARFLGRSVEQLEAAGVVSADTAARMAAAAIRETGADWAVALTGVAGPDLQEGKPVGTVYVGISGPGWEPVAVLVRLGDHGRQRVREGAVHHALSLLLSMLSGQNTEFLTRREQ